MPFRFTACASNARLEHHAPKENKVKRKLPYKLLKTVCYRVFKSLQHWLAGRFVRCQRGAQVASLVEWMEQHCGKAAQMVSGSPWAHTGWAKGPEFMCPGSGGNLDSLEC